MCGKSIGAIVRLAKQYHVPVIVLAASLFSDSHAVSDLGIDAINVLPSGLMSLDAVMEQAASLITQATERALRLVKIRQNIQYKNLTY